MILKIKKMLPVFRLKYSSGLAQIPLIIGLLLMAVAIPAATKLVQENSDTRNRAQEGGCGDPSACRSWEKYENGCCRSYSGCSNHSDCGDGKLCVDGTCQDAPKPSCDECSGGEKCDGERYSSCEDGCWREHPDQNDKCKPKVTEPPVTTPVAQPTKTHEQCAQECAGLDTGGGTAYDICINTCLGVVSDNCKAGETKCSGGVLQVCQYATSVGTKWYSSACASGVCADAAACADKCPGVCAADWAPSSNSVRSATGACPNGETCWVVSGCEGGYADGETQCNNSNGYNKCDGGVWYGYDCASDERCTNGMCVLKDCNDYSCAMVCAEAGSTDGGSCVNGACVCKDLTVTPSVTPVPLPADGTCTSANEKCVGKWSGSCTCEFVNPDSADFRVKCKWENKEYCEYGCSVSGSCSPKPSVAPVPSGSKCLIGDGYCIGKGSGDSCGASILGVPLYGSCVSTVLGHCICNILDGNPGPGPTEDDPRCGGKRGAMCSDGSAIFCVYESVPGIGSILKIQTEERCSIACDGETGECKVGDGCNWFTSSSYCQGKSVGQSCVRQHAPSDDPVSGVCELDPSNFGSGGCACVPVDNTVSCEDLCAGEGYGSLDYGRCLNECQSNPGKQPKYSCDVGTGTCGLDYSGSYTDAAQCLNNCKKETVPGACSIGECRSSCLSSETSTGISCIGQNTFSGQCCVPKTTPAQSCIDSCSNLEGEDRMRCLANCGTGGQTLRYTCNPNSGDCYPDYTGSYGAYDQCLAGCRRTTPVVTNPPGNDVTPTNPPSGGTTPTVPAGGGPGPGPGGSDACDYTSLQLRVQPDSATAWTKSLTIENGGTVNVGCMYNGSGQLADPNKVKIVAKYAVDGSEVEIGKQYVAAWRPSKLGRVDIRCESTDSNCPLTSGGDGTVLIVAGESCYECPTNFECYKKGSDYKWFVEGYTMNDYAKVAGETVAIREAQCTAAGVVKPTFKGKGKADADCNGYINGDDYSIWRKEYVDELKTNNRWEADFSCKGKVDNTDYSTWRKSSIDDGNDR